MRIDRGVVILENAPNKMRVATTTSRPWQVPSLVFGLVLLWKIALLVFTVQPVPGNDAFFYDGPVVNYLLHGKYVNPALAMTLPISGSEVFSAYPPLYQAALFVWMRLFGTSAVSAMVFHVVLFGLYSVVVIAILNRLCVPAWCNHMASLFMLVLTFHDRPDSLAHVLGMLGVLGLVRYRTAAVPKQRSNRPGSLWFMAACAILCTCTSLQIGAVYLCVIWLATLAAWLFRHCRPALAPITTMLVTPCVLVCVVALFFPKLWAGFVEHARVTPSMMGLHMPSLTDLLKICRTVPGVLVAGLLLVWLWYTRRIPKGAELGETWLITFASVVTGLMIAVVCMFFWSANMVLMGAYLQPLAVACVLAALTTVLTKDTLRRMVFPVFGAAALLGAIRAIGMSTWGVACAVDMDYSRALDIVRTELAELPRQGPVVLSSAYLYEAAKYRDLNCVHSDWVGKFVRGKQNQELGWLLELKPPKLILTQFDYYRRYESVLSRLKNSGVEVEVIVVNTAKVRAPDSYCLWRRVIQHISWAPVIVELSWR